jgi:hypothetical protein
VLAEFLPDEFPHYHVAHHVVSGDLQALLDDLAAGDRLPVHGRDDFVVTLCHIGRLSRLGLRFRGRIHRFLRICGRIGRRDGFLRVARRLCSPRGWRSL